jgi:hypothetical protein
MRTMSWPDHVACVGNRTGAYRILVGKPEEKRPFPRPRCICKDNIKMNLQEIGGGVKLSASGQWQVTGSCERDDEHLGCL